MLIDENLLSLRIYQFFDYKAYLKASIASLPRNGRGVLKEIAQILGVHPSFVSQVINGDKDFSIEQASDLAGFLQLNHDETEYLLCLVEIERAGTARLKTFLKGKQKRLAEQGNRLAVQFPESPTLSDADRAKFYSQWHYSAIHLLTDIPRFQDEAVLRAWLNLPKELVDEALNFLLSAGLITRVDGKLACGPTWVFEPAGTPNAVRHHINWRLKGFDRMNGARPDETFLTLPVTISQKDREVVQEMIREFVTKVKKVVEPSSPEQLAVITIDLFGMT